MGVVNHYTSFSKTTKFLLNRGITPKNHHYATIHNSVSYLYFDRYYQGHQALTYCMGRKEGKTYLCALLTGLVASLGQRVSYIPAHTKSGALYGFRLHVQNIFPDVQIKENCIKVGKGEILIQRTKCLRGAPGPFIFDDIDDNEKCWNTHCEMRPSIGFWTRDPRWI